MISELIMKIMSNMSLFDIMALSRVNRGMRRCAISLINKKGKAKIDAKNYKNCKVLGKEEFKLRYKSLTLTVCCIFYFFLLPY